MKITMHCISVNYVSFLMFCCLMSIIENIHSQSLDYDIDFPQYIPKDPTAYSFAKYIDYPVSLYTGIPEISIPLYEIQLGGLKIPISISYHASGIVASQEATRVGLGWNINAGGIISRSVKCGDDFQEHSSPNGIIKGYFETPEAKAPYSEGFFNTGYSARYLCGDSEPDLFFYSLPGASGKFVFGKDSIPVLFNKEINVKIKLKKKYGKKVNFEITDTNGTLYVFDQYEETSTHMRDICLSLNDPSNLKCDVTNESEIRSFSGTKGPFSYVSSWFLSKIITNTNDTICFSYTTESYQLPVQESAAKQNVLSASGGWVPPSWGGTRVLYNCTKTTISTQRLSQISWRGGKILFEGTDREDIISFFTSESPKKISAIKIFDRNNKLIKNYGFEYTYFNNENKNGFPQVFKRLKLVKLIDGSGANGTYEFNYADGILPAKNTKNTDFWGYYNGSIQKMDYYSSTVFNGRLYNGGDKEPNFQYMKIGILESVKYPTGGIVTFTYEPNKYNSPPYYTSEKAVNYLNSYYGAYDENYSDFPASQSDTITLSLTTDIKIDQYFEYVGSSPKPTRIPYGDKSYPVFTISQLTSYGTFRRLYSYPIPLAFKTANNYSPLTETIKLNAGTYILEANPVMNDTYSELCYQYDKMVEHQGEEKVGGGLRIAKINGEKETLYTYEDGVLLVEPIFSHLLNKSATESVSPFRTSNVSYLMQYSESAMPMTSLKNNNIFGYSIVTETFSDNARNVYTYFNEAESKPDYMYLPTEINYYNGLLQNESVYNSASEILRTTDYVYLHSVLEKPIYGFVYRNYGTVYPFSYRFLWPYLSHKRICDYENMIVSEYDYLYNDYFQKMEEIFKSGNNIYTKKNIYVTDRDDNVSLKMKEKHMIGCPIETLLMKDNLIIKGKKIAYREFGNMILPEKEYSIETITPLSLNNYSNYFKQKMQFSDYNYFGLPMQVNCNNNNRVYLWSYNSTYPVAEIKNVTYSQIEQLLGKDFIQKLVDKNAPSVDDIIKIRNISLNVVNSQITTYTYQPLVGMTSRTDPSGLTTYYDYDDFNRLKRTYIKEKDSSGNEIEKNIQTYDYHYKNQ